MKKNMSAVDRGIRVILAILFGVLYFTSTVTGIWGIILLVLGAIFLLTSLVGYCPLYSIAGMSTRYKERIP